MGMESQKGPKSNPGRTAGDISALRLLEKILRRRISWADEVVSPFAVKTHARAMKHRRRRMA
jgi:hypothetical protein